MKEKTKSILKKKMKFMDFDNLHSINSLSNPNNENLFLWIEKKTNKTIEHAANLTSHFMSRFIKIVYSHV